MPETQSLTRHQPALHKQHCTARQCTLTEHQHSAALIQVCSRQAHQHQHRACIHSALPGAAPRTSACSASSSPCAAARPLLAAALDVSQRSSARARLGSACMHRFAGCTGRTVTALFPASPVAQTTLKPGGESRGHYTVCSRGWGCQAREAFGAAVHTVTPNFCPVGVICQSSMICKRPSAPHTGAEPRPICSPGHHVMHCWRAPLDRRSQKATLYPARCLLAAPRDRTYLTPACCGV